MSNEIQLKEVTVYQNSASFKLIGEYHCKVGENELVINHLTNKMDKDSVRVKGLGSGKLVNIIVDKIYSDEMIKEKIKKLAEEREILVKQRNRLNVSSNNTIDLKEKTLLAQERFSQEFPKWFSYGKIDIDSVKNMNDMFREKIKELTSELEEIEEQLEQVQKKIDKLNNTINELGYDNQVQNESYYKIIVIIDADKEDDFTIELSFMVYDAYWTPFYDITISDSTVDIDLMANVYNLTDIDWKDIILNVSTATTEPVKLEKPQPYNIDHHYPIPDTTRGVRTTTTGSDMDGRLDFAAQCNVASEDIAGLDRGIMAGEITELEQVDSSMTSNFGVQVYNLKSKFNISSDKNPKPVHLFKDTLPSITQYFWTTISPNRVLCNNKIKNNDRLILPGPAKIYIKDEYIGETSLDLIAPNQEFKLGERITYDIRIKKIMKEKNKQKEGVLKGKKSISYKYDLIIENLNGVKEQLILYERLPHSVSERIKIKLGNFTESYVRNVMNVFKFVINMDKVNEKKIITYDYDVIYDKEINIYPPLP
ncbi:MAG: mucoidy inhibitor MuiA family protein [Candidatus Hermodarchaeota archaeon]